MSKTLAVLFALVVSGCAGPKFEIVGDNNYTLSKLSSACAVGDPNAVLDELKKEAAKFCAGRREVPVFTSESAEAGIPVVRCASAKITFGCAPPK